MELPPGHRTVFGRMILVFVVTSVLVALAIGGFFRWHFAGQGPFRGIFAKNALHYAARLADEIGIPPSEPALRKLHEELGIGIRVRAGGEEKAYPPDTPRFSDVRPWHRSRIPGMRMGRMGRAFFALYEPQAGRSYLFLFTPEPGAIVSPWPWIGLVLLLFCILFLAHRTIRRLVQPLASDIRRMIADKEQLLLDVSHELRSPLARSRVALELIPKGEARTHLEEDMREMETMVNQLLESSRLQDPGRALRMRPVAVSDIIARSVDRLSPSPIPVEVASREPLLVKADDEQLIAAVRNLLDNARKYTALKGTGSQAPVQVAWAHRTSERNEPGVEITIRDQGIGIPPDELSRVFEPFYRVDRSRTKATGGIGLGLSLAQRIIRSHGGTLSLESAEGKGTIARIWLPTAPT
ncbi:MAG: HAMP domain-containing histidine kinase [Deltaproteobacteria bacterium]|nr:HAMP domain-containing histidine kinase [Deltaproteobacteria bacterium]